MALADYFGAISSQMNSASSGSATNAQAIIAEVQTMTDTTAILAKVNAAISGLQKNLTANAAIVTDMQSKAGGMASALQSKMGSLGAITTPDALIAKVPSASTICTGISTAGNTLLAEAQGQAGNITTQLSAVMAQLTGILSNLTK